MFSLQYLEYLGHGCFFFIGLHFRFALNRLHTVLDAGRDGHLAKEGCPFFGPDYDLYYERSGTTINTDFTTWLLLLALLSLSLGYLSFTRSSYSSVTALTVCFLAI